MATHDDEDVEVSSGLCFLSSLVGIGANNCTMPGPNLSSTSRRQLVAIVVFFPFDCYYRALHVNQPTNEPACFHLVDIIGWFSSQKFSAIISSTISAMHLQSLPRHSGSKSRRREQQERRQRRRRSTPETTARRRQVDNDNDDIAADEKAEGCRGQGPNSFQHSGQDAEQLQLAEVEGR